jgi:hypothetical protein
MFGGGGINCTPGSKGCFNVPTKEQQQCLNNHNGPLTDLEQLVIVLDATKQPMFNIATSAALFDIGGLLLVGPWVLAPEVCAGSGGLACGVYVFGSVHVSAGGVFLLKGGYEFTKEVTIPSILGGKSPTGGEKTCSGGR